MSATYMAWTLSECGRFNEGLRYGQDGVLLAKEINHAWTFATASWGLASLYINRRDSHAAINLLEPAFPLSKEWHFDALTPGIKGSLGFAYAISGRLEEGLQMLKGAVKDIEASGRLAFHTLFNVYLGEVLLKTSEYDDAVTIAAKALDLARERGEKGFEAMALHLMAEICAHKGPAKRARAEQLYGQSIELARKLNMRPLVARCHLGLGYLLRGFKRTDQSHENYVIALSDFRDMQMQHFVTITEAALREF